MIVKLRNDIKTVMLEKKNTTGKEKALLELKYQTLKNILEKAQKIAKERKKEDITDSMVIDAAKKEIKQLMDFLGYCKEGTDHFKETNYCILCAKDFLPQMANEQQIIAFLKENKENITNVGSAMKLLKAEFKDTLDGKMASGIVKEFLGEKNEKKNIFIEIVDS